MDANLKEQLRAMGVLPLELNSILQRYYDAFEIDWTQLVTRDPPGTSQEYIDQCEAIEDNVRVLYGLEFHGQEKTPEYHQLETQIQEQLREITTPRTRYANATELLPAKTGTGGCVMYLQAEKPTTTLLRIRDMLGLTPHLTGTCGYERDARAML